MIRLALVALLLAGCTAKREAIRQPSPAVAVTCDAVCLASCVPTEWPQITGDPDSPKTWDEGPEAGATNREIAQRCDIARASCVACIKRIEAVGLVCGITEACK